MLPTGALAGAALDTSAKALKAITDAFAGLANALREVQRIVKEFAPVFRAFGEGISRVIGVVGDSLRFLFRDINAFLRPTMDLTKKVVVDGFREIAEFLRPTLQLTKKVVADGFREIAAFLRPTIDLTKKVVVDGFREIHEFMKPAIHVLKEMFREVMKVVAPIVEPFRRAIGQLFAKLLDTEVLWKPLTRAMAGLGIAAGAAIAGLGAVAAGLAVVGNIANAFVSKANPVVAQQFTLAVDDLMAVIGQALVPVMRIVTDLVRAAADTFASFSKDIGGVAGDLLAPIAQMLKEVFSIIGLVGNALASVLKTIGPIVTALLQLIADAVSSVMRFVESILELFGISPGRREGAATGAAVRSASTTDVESVLRKARESAFSLGTASREDPARATVDILGAIRGKMNDLVEAVKGLPERIARAVLGDTATDAIEGVVDTLGDVKNAILDFGRSGLEAAGLRDRPGGGAGVLGPALAAAEAFRDRAGAGSGVVMEAF